MKRWMLELESNRVVVVPTPPSGPPVVLIPSMCGNLSFYFGKCYSKFYLRTSRSVDWLCKLTLPVVTSSLKQTDVWFKRCMSFFLKNVLFVVSIRVMLVYLIYFWRSLRSFSLSFIVSTCVANRESSFLRPDRFLQATLTASGLFSQNNGQPLRRPFVRSVTRLLCRTETGLLSSSYLFCFRNLNFFLILESVTSYDKPARTLAHCFM